MPKIEIGKALDDIRIKIAELSGKKTGIAASARGSTASLSIAAGASVKITLNTWIARTNTGFVFSAGGIKCPYAGTVMISGSVYVYSDGIGGCYIYKGGSEISATWGQQGTGGGIGTGTLITTVKAGDVIYLRARSNLAGSCAPNNVATHLDITYL